MTASTADALAPVEAESAEAAETAEAADVQGIDTASLARVLAEISAIQRSSSVTNENFAAAIRTCQEVLDSSLAAVQET